jgi:hypothetical protein
MTQFQSVNNCDLEFFPNFNFQSEVRMFKQVVSPILNAHNLDVLWILECQMNGLKKKIHYVGPQV